MTTTDQPGLKDHIDLGAAPLPPSWCVPGTQPNTDSVGDNYLWAWYRNFADGVWIQCDDTIVDGRIVRSRPELVVGDVESNTWFSEKAVEFAKALLEAAEVFDAALLEFTS